LVGFDLLTQNSRKGLRWPSQTSRRCWWPGQTSRSCCYNKMDSWNSPIQSCWDSWNLRF